MRRITASLCAAAVAAVTALGAPTSPAEATDSSSPEIVPVPAMAADSVVEGLGIGIHLNFLDTPYRDANAVGAALDDLGVRHVRDDLYLDAPHQYAAIKHVAARANVRFNLIMGRPGGPATPADYVDTVATELPAGVVESLEGVNEWDHFGPDEPAAWVPQMIRWQRRLWAAAKAEAATADLPVLSPALAFRWNYAEVGDLSRYADLANAHMYPGGYSPSNEITRITDALRQAIPEKPLVTTETGYHNALNTTNGHLPVPEDVASVYMPRLLLEHLRRGEKRVYLYELIDSFNEPGHTNPEAHFGLLNHDLSPKPAYTAMQRLLALLEDPGAAFSPGFLDAAVDGFPSDARHLLTQKRDGSFVLLLWREVSVWDPVERQRIVVEPAEVTIHLDAPADLTVHRPSETDTPVAQGNGTSLHLSLDGQVTAVAIEPVESSPPPSPSEVTALRGHRRAVVSWELPESSAAVTSFEVTRLPDGVTRTLGGQVRSYVDTGLVNGVSYTYAVRSRTVDGSSSAVTSAAVVPAAVPAAPRNVAVRPRRKAVTVTWRAASPRGSAITAYRLTGLGRSNTVHVRNSDARRFRARLTRLPSDRRLRVAVRARNDLGWGAAAYTRRVRTR